jgi:nucleotide-binding universal stress UspA family protein
MEKTITKILVAYDHSAAASVALHKGMDVARRFRAAFHVVFVEAEEKKADYESILKSLEEESSRTGLKIEMHHRRGKAYREITQCEKEIGADLLLVGSHGTEGFVPFWLGSAAFRVASSSNCPVITVPEASRDQVCTPILMPIDSTPESRQKLGHTAVIAKAYHSNVHILCLSKAQDAETQHHLAVYEQQAIEFFDARGVRNSSEVHFGVNVAQTILETAQKMQAGLISMMTETEPAGFFMGSVAQHLINHAPVPVMAIRPKHVMVAGGGL